MPFGPESGTPGAASSPRSVEEQDASPSFPGLVQPEWARRWPWLAQGVTWQGTDGSFDLGMAGPQPVGRVLERWRRLQQALGFSAVICARQVHGRAVLQHVVRPDGLLLTGPADGHATLMTDLLLTVTVADCVPVFMVDPGVRAIALLHAGWRGTAAGIAGQGIAALTTAGGSRADLHVHLGPAICGRCYEVGPEVHQALGRISPAGAEPIDLRQVLHHQICEAGVPPEAVTASSACTRCQPDRFFSHRAGAAGRQLAWLGLVAT